MIDFNIATACRICLEDDATYPIFESNETSERIHFKLTVCLKNKITDIPGYPRNICIKCKNLSETICKFIDKFEDTCKLLESKIPTVKTEVLYKDIDSNTECDNDSFIYNVEIENIIKVEPNVEKNDPVALLGSLSGLTVKKIKVKNENDIAIINDDIDKGNVKPSKPFNAKKNVPKKHNKPVGIVKPKSTKAVEALRKERLRLAQIKLQKEQEKLEYRRQKLQENVNSTQKLCDHCGDTFMSAEALGRHVRSKHTERKYKCTKCSKGYHSSRELEDHVSSQHEQIRNAVCDTCGKAFFSKKVLSSHMRSVHAKTKRKTLTNYKCQFCEKTCHYKRGIVIHERSVHTGERPAVCSICQSAFYDEVYLAEHMRIHTGHTPFKCPVCGRGYTQRGNMKSHMRNHKISELSPENIAVIKPNYFKFMRP